MRTPRQLKEAMELLAEPSNLEDLHNGHREEYRKLDETVEDAQMALINELAE